MVKEEKSESLTFYILIHKVYNWLMDTEMLGPKNIPMNYIVNLQKMGTPIYIAFLMFYFGNYSQAMWIYFGFHGTYGIAWQVKDSVFPDAVFQKKVSFLATVAMYILILGPYCVGSWMIASDRAWQEIPNQRISLAFYIYIIGSILVFCADCQKYFTLQLKKGLISSGFFKYSRNPNYLGEMMIYFSFALLVNEPLFYWINFYAWLALFVSQMKAKDRSFAKKEGWEEYKERSWMLLFKINGSAVLSCLVYGLAGAALGYCILKTGGLNVIPRDVGVF